MSWKDTLQRITGAKSTAEKAVQQLEEELTVAREAITAKRSEHERARTALWPRAEMIAEAERLVDEAGQWWAQDHTYGFLQRLAGRLSEAHLRGGDTTAPSYAALPFSPVEPVPFGAACFFRASEWKTAFRAAITSADYEPGTPRADRPALLERLARELAELEGIEEGIVDAMAASGIVTPHRPEVIARRDREQRARDVAAQRLKDQQWLEEQKAAGHLGTPRMHTAQMYPDGRPRGQA